MQADLFEVWKPVPDYEGVYEVSNWGRVRSLPRNGTVCRVRIMQLTQNKGGYLQIGLRRDDTRRYYRVHRLVACAFLGRCPDGLQVNHIDLNKTNNHIGNLEYVTAQENIQHAALAGCYHRGEKNAAARLLEDDVKTIRTDYAAGKVTQHELAKRYGVSQSTIWRALHTHWGHV